MSVVEQLYESTVKNLPEEDRRRLVTLVIRDLNNPPVDLSATEGYSDTWTDEDIRDLRAYVSGYASEAYPEAEDIV